MDCIPYINDLIVEIDILKQIKKNNNNEKINQLIDEKERLIYRCKQMLKQLSNNQICYRIYLKTLEGMTPTKAIEKVADENYYNDIKPTSLSALWKYYQKIKNISKIK